MALDGHRSTLRHYFGANVVRSLRPGRPRDSECLFLAWNDDRGRLGFCSIFGPAESSGNESFRRVEFFDRGPAVHGSRDHFPGDALLDPRAGEFVDSVRCRFQLQLSGHRRHLVAGRAALGRQLFRNHFTSVSRKSQRSPRHSRLLLNPRCQSVTQAGRQAGRLCHFPGIRCKRQAPLRKWIKFEILWEATKVV
jgi:hypothetical protein